jgi:hypothetical protein
MYFDDQIQKQVDEILDCYKKNSSWEDAYAYILNKKISKDVFMLAVLKLKEIQATDFKAISDFLLSLKFDQIQIEQHLLNFKSKLYYWSLKQIIQNGGTYSELLKINPMEFGLQSEMGITNKPQTNKIILSVIIDEFSTSNFQMAIDPSLRLIAEEIKAPYSVMIDCFNLVRNQQHLMTDITK